MVNPTSPNPYWSKAIQHQQKSQVKPQQQPQQPKPQESKTRDFGGFDTLIVGKDCLIKLGNGEAIKGVVSAASKYFYLVTAGGQVMVVNKAYVVMVMPIQPQNNNTNMAGDSNGGEQSSKSK